MKYCSRCLYPANHPLHLTFDEQGVCSGCRIHEEKDVLNWEERGEKLGKLLDNFKNKSGRNYDCVIPVSGGRDSYFIVHTVKNVYGLNPLLVTYNKQYNTSVGIRNLAYLKTLFGCDCLTMTISPEAVKNITRLTVKKMASMYWHCIAGQTVLPVQTAVRYKIPLIIWGAHQGNDQVGMFSHLDEVEMTRKYRKEHDLMGFEAEDLAESKQMNSNDLRPFFYPHDKDIERVGVRGIYLNNFIRWDSKKQHELMIKKFGYETARQHRTFDTYNDVDCFNYSDLHDYIKFLKYGYGKVTDQATREIRLKRLSRQQGIDLVKKYQDMKPDPYRLKLFLNWLEIPEDEFWQAIDAHRDPSIWKKQNGVWKLLDSVINHSNDANTAEVKLKLSGKCQFKLTKPKVANAKEGEYILIGRGWVESKK